MPILTVTLAFSSDNGDAESFTGFDSDYTDGIYDSGEGDPAGSVRFDAGNNIGNFRFRTHAQTFEAWGVPAGATITGVQNWTVDAAHFETGTNGTHWPGAALVAGGVVSRYSYPPSSQSGDTAWATLPLQDTSDTMYPLASTELCSFRLDLDCNTGSDGLASVHYDNISVDIIYTTGADVTGEGNLLAQNSVVSGTGTVTTIIRGTGALQSQEALVNGYVYSLPPIYELAKEKTVNEYKLYIDGVLIPLIKFTIKRNVTTEITDIVLPLLWESELATATTIIINMELTNVYGVETITQLFSGTLINYTKSEKVLTGNCAGAVSYPANAVRDFNNVSYSTDDGNYYMYRLQIDPRFYPGDVGMFGSRRININRVTIYANQYQATMELSDVGQV